MSKQSYTEPAAELREMASAMWQTYVALTREGFSEQQALVILGHCLTANAIGGTEE